MTAPLRFPLSVEGRKPHAVVIGAGLGGLAMAVRLAVRGYQVAVFERCEQAGGRASVFRQDGFTFDAGPTIITAPHLLEELWALAGRRMADDVPLVPMNPFYELRFHDGSRLRCSGDADAMRAEIGRLSPGDVAGYERFLEWSRTVFEVGFDKLGNQPFPTPWSMARATPEIISLGGLRSIHAMASRFVKDERIRIALSFHPLFIGGNPLKATAIYGLVAHLSAIGACISPRAARARSSRGCSPAGKPRRPHPLRRHRRAHPRRGPPRHRDPAGDGRGGAGASGREQRRFRLDARAAAAAGGARAADEPQAPERLALLRPFVWYFGTRKRYEAVPHHSIILGPRYEGLLDDIFRRKHLAEDFSLYLHRPTATDPSLAPEGCDTFYVLSPVPHLGSGTDWRQQAEPYRRAVERRLNETVLPGFARRSCPRG